MLYGLDFIKCDLDYSKRIYEEQVKEDGRRFQKTLWRCPYYNRWVGMLERCFSDKFKNKHPTYKDVTCCEEWHLFSNFKSWMEQQDYEGKQLDKDLLIYQNKVYSPETCCFISQSLNKFMTKNNACRGDLPLGVAMETKHKNGEYVCRLKYRSAISYDNHSTRIGGFETTEEAHRAWQSEKMRLTYVLFEKESDDKVREGLFRVYSKIKFDYDNNLITEDF